MQYVISEITNILSYFLISKLVRFFVCSKLSCNTASQLVDNHAHYYKRYLFIALSFFILIYLYLSAIFGVILKAARNLCENGIFLLVTSNFKKGSDTAGKETYISKTTFLYLLVYYAVII